MSRVQLALRVADLDAAVDFYSRLFDAVPAKRRPGYANFAIAEPPLKLVLLEGESGEPTRMDHLGVEVGDAEGQLDAGHGDPPFCQASTVVDVFHRGGDIDVCQYDDRRYDRR